MDDENDRLGKVLVIVLNTIGIGLFGLFVLLLMVALRIGL